MSIPIHPEGQSISTKRFMGLPYQDKQTLAYAKGTIITSWVGLGYFFVRTIIIAAYSQYFYYTEMIWVLTPVLLVMCAHYGARDQNQSLIGCFACWSGFSMALNAYILYTAIIFAVTVSIILVGPSLVIGGMSLYYSIQFCIALRRDVIVIIQAPADGGQVMLHTNTIPVAQTSINNTQPIEQPKIYYGHVLQPGYNQQPDYNQRPNYNQQIGHGPVPVHAQQPMNNQQSVYNQPPNYTQQPASRQEAMNHQQPVFSQQPTTSQQPVYSQQAMDYQQPVLNPQSLYNQHPSSSQQPVYNNQPPMSSQEPGYSQQAMSSQRPV